MQSRGGVNIAEQTIPIIDENGKVVRKTFEELKAIEKKKADELKVAEQARIKAIEAQIGIEKQLQQALVDNKIPDALNALTEQLKKPLTIVPPPTAAAAGATTRGGSTTENRFPSGTASEADRAANALGMSVLQATFKLKSAFAGQGNIDTAGAEVAKALAEYIKANPGMDPGYDVSRLDFRLEGRNQDLLAKIVDTIKKNAEDRAANTPERTGESAESSTQELLRQKNAAIAEMERSLAATRAAMGMNGPLPSAVNTLPPTRDAQVPTGVQDVAASLLAGISASNPLPVKVINVAEFRGNGGVGAENNGEKYNMFTTVEAKAFLSDFTNSISSFKTYVDNLQRIISVPIKIDINARHTVDVRVTGAAAFEAFKGDFTNLILNEIDKKFQQIWARSGGQLGSSGASARAVQPQQF
jgi:hypothetical protein